MKFPATATVLWRHRNVIAIMTCGDTLTLFAASVALLALFVASYTGRSTWLACGSTAMSMAVLVGCIFLSTIEVPSQVRARFVWIAGQLPLDRQTLDDLTTAIEQVSTCGLKERLGCMTAASRASQGGDLLRSDGDLLRSADSPPAGRQAKLAAATTRWLEAKQDSKARSRSPVIWLLGEPKGPIASSMADEFSISGINLSDQALKEVHGTLKPDSSQLEVELALHIEGRKFEDETVIPAGAHFSLGSEFPKADRSKQFEGAIFTFRYMYAGQQKASILYLTASMIARLANRG